MKKKILFIVVGLGIAVAAGVGCWWKLSEKQETLNLPGIVEIQEVRLASKVGGRVARVVVAEGDIVEAGQPLVYFEVPELEAQRYQLEAKVQSVSAELDRAIAGARVEDRATAKATVDMARARWQKLVAGPRVEEIDQARADVKVAEADLQWAERDLDRASKLAPKIALSKADQDAAHAAQLRASGRLSAAAARLKLLETGTRPEEIDEAAADLARAKAQFDLLEAGTRPEDIAEIRARLAEAKARLQEVDVKLAEAVVVAPEKAVVEVLAVRKGDVVTANQPVIRVLRAEDMWVKVFVPETELGKVRLRQKVEVTVDSYPGRNFQGEVIQVASISEFTPRNVQSPDERRHQVFAVKVRVADPQGVFKSGMAAQVVLPLHD
jgi:multidrug resistance efflux pump